MSGNPAVKPVDVPTRETAAFVMSHAAAKAPVLEVGCGEGDVASVLLNRGYGVIAVDASEKVVARAQERGVPAVCARWPEFECGAVDTVAFTRSLHHIVPLSGAIQKARELLTKKGVLLVEDFSLYEADETTMNWFLETLRSPAGRGLIQPDRGEFVSDLLGADDVVVAWRKCHHHDLHTITAMTQAIAEEFIVRETCAVPYLYRYLVPALPETPQAAEFLQGVFEEEASLGERGDIVLIGRRIVAAL